MMVKCVIWDLDNTLLSGVYLESGQQPPPPDPAMTAVAAELGSRGIIHAVASRNPPEAAEYAAQAAGLHFAAAECGWGNKSDSVRRIVAGLGLAPDAVVFVDDDPHERAEVSLAMPEVLVLSPEDMTDAIGWPEFSPPTVTAEARRRGEMYAQRRRRQDEARTFSGSRADFLRYCGTEMRIARAVAADVPRLHELSVRTHQFNTRGEAVTEPELGRLVQSPAHQVAVVRLADRFGDDGMVGATIVEHGVVEHGVVEHGVVEHRGAGHGAAGHGAGPEWTVTLLMMSCRAMGRGVIEVLLAWLIRSAAGAGAASLTVPCLVTPRNVPLRLALASAGFRAAEPGSPGTPAARFARALSGPLPTLPDWVTAPEQW
jgi:FkbH-like protein